MTAALRERNGGAAATRRAILAAAEALLARGGEAGLSIRELCARAGVTPPTVYHHFGDKGALVDRLVDACFAEFDRTFMRRRPPADPVEALRWGFDRYVEYGLAHPAHYRLMFQRSMPRRPTSARARLTTGCGGGWPRSPRPGAWCRPSRTPPPRSGRPCTASPRS